MRRPTDCRAPTDAHVARRPQEPIRNLGRADALEIEPANKPGLVASGLPDLISRGATVIARFVAKQTVYPFAEIQKLFESEVLAILFRQARLVNQRLGL